MKELAFKLWNGTDDIPLGVRILTLVTSIRWFGWGFAESLLPVFLYSFVGSYAQAGLLRSVHDVAFIVSLPLIGMAADRMRSTVIVLAGLALYLLVGTGYLFAGLTGLAIFVVIARFVNGIGYALDSVGRETYFRRHTEPSRLATVFGYFDTVADFWWIAAAILGIVLIRYVQIHWLLFLITPTTLISLVILSRFSRRERRRGTEVVTPAQRNARYRDLLREFGTWDWRLRLLTVFNFFVSFTGSVVMFFLPIQMYNEGSGLVPVIVVGVITTIPALFGWVLGDLFDRKGIRVFGYGLLAFAVMLTGLGFLSGYLWQTIIAFLVGIVLELLSVGSNELVTVYANPEHFGRVDGMTRSLIDIGGMVGPLVVGIVVDAWGIHVALFGLAFLVLALAGAFVVASRFMKWDGRAKPFGEGSV